MHNSINPEDVKGNAKVADEWVLFSTLERDDEIISDKYLKDIPEEITVSGKTLNAEKISATDKQFNIKKHIGKPYDDAYLFKAVYFFIPITSETGGLTTIGMSGDALIQAWINGEKLFDGEEITSNYPSICCDNTTDAELKKGENLLVIRLVTGRVISTLAVGGPEELRKKNLTSIISDPFSFDSRWTDPSLSTKPGKKEAVNIGSRLELFVDEYMVDDMSGAIERRMHHPVIKETVFYPDKPWEGPTSGYYSLIEYEGKIRFYYSGRPNRNKEFYANKEQGNTEYAKDQVTCMLESEDGSSFERPNLGLVEFQGSKNNNILFQGPQSHNFTVFLDKNPNAKPEEKFKALSYHKDSAKGKEDLSAFCSADGIHWNTMVDEPVITHDKCGTEPGQKICYGFDSQNTSFWDHNIGKYVCYYRSNSGGFRRIYRCESADYINWENYAEVEYNDEVLYQHYTNCIHLYPRAPHIYIGTPARYVDERKKISDHIRPSVSDTILIAGRDGRVFDKWEEGFIRPTTDPKSWTDRNSYTVWGMLQTAPEELSIYWGLHDYKTNQLIRGTIRTDGFVSVQAPGNKVGEMLTRPFIFDGCKLRINYATSAIGSIRFELCDAGGKAIEGYTLAESEILYGNEIEYDVLWNGSSDVSALAGKEVRLRVRMQDADFYSFKFCNK